MHPHLLRSLDSVTDHFRSDPRCLGMYLHGSIGRGETDQWSDIDVCAVIEDAAYEQVKSEMRAVCERHFGPIVVWLPEGERPAYVNYAFLFEHGGEVLLTDFDIITRSLFMEWDPRPDRLLWDRDGFLADAAAKARADARVTDERVLHLIDTYWVYAYLDGKYWRRRDLYKLLYVQQTLLQLHVRLLMAAHAGSEGGWWAGDIASLPSARRRRLRSYFTGATLSSAARGFARSIDAFALDAAELCAARGLVYPANREEAVRRHLASAGLPVAPGEA